MPEHIQKRLSERGRIAADSCSEPLHVDTTHYYATEKIGLLIMVKPTDYLCTFSNSFIPVVVTPDGEWQMGKQMEGAPSLMATGPDNTLWLVSQWQIEGTYPILFTSRDGVNWETIPLPAERDVDCCFERITRLCVDDTTIEVTFYGDSEEREETWSAPRQPENGSRWEWAKTHSNVVYNDKRCPPLVPGNGIWTRIEETQEVMVLHRNDDAGTITVRIPERIQIGP